MSDTGQRIPETELASKFGRHKLDITYRLVLKCLLI